MMMTSEKLSCSLVTTHIGYAEVPRHLSIKRIIEVIKLSHDALTRIRGSKPRIVVLGLNPHAGENGLFGNQEERDVIVPAIEHAVSLGINVIGPLPPDTAFLPWRLKETDCHVCMMMTSEKLNCSLVTTHIGYAEVPRHLSIKRIIEVIKLSHDALTRIRGSKPRIVVLGLNPHAGENGLFGNQEERDVIVPAIEHAVSLGINVIGPLPPDTAFLPWRLKETDCHVCMYHDQGLIPFKTLAFDTGVNVTLGLSAIRTSVDHGTALDIAWQGTTDPSSLISAITLAAKLASDHVNKAH